jgi:RimJ/RimL family protein N-acetyltransferase
MTLITQAGLTTTGPGTVQGISLRRPSADLLDGYRLALEAGWSPTNDWDSSQVLLEAIRSDPEGFIADFTWNPGSTFPTPGGGRRERLRGRTFWLWDGEFCGSVNFRYVPGTEDLPPGCHGHIGYSVIPSKRGRGYATRALSMLLPVIAEETGLKAVQITCRPSNHASAAVIRRNGGVSVPEASNAPGFLAFRLAVPVQRPMVPSARYAGRYAGRLAVGA